MRVVPIYGPAKPGTTYLPTNLSNVLSVGMTSLECLSMNDDVVPRSRSESPNPPSCRCLHLFQHLCLYVPEFPNPS